MYRKFVNKNTYKIINSIHNLNCKIFIIYHQNEHFIINNDRVSFKYRSLSTLKQNMVTNLNIKIHEAISRCRTGVQTVLSHQKFHRKILYQPTTSLITEHGPTRVYLQWRNKIASDLCPSCSVAETYDHVARICSRFRDIHLAFNCQDHTNINSLITHLINNNDFVNFANCIHNRLRALNSFL